MLPTADGTPKVVEGPSLARTQALPRDVLEGNPAVVPKILSQDALFEDGERVRWHRGSSPFQSHALVKKVSWLQPVTRIAINLFLGFHILAIACWCVPLDTPLLPLIRNLVRPYFLWSGLFQSWDMFAPIPKAANTYVEAVVVFKDGSREVWPLPRMEDLSLTERYFKERYRKFADNLQVEENESLLPDVARHIARLNSTPPRQVKTVILVQKWSFIVPRTDGSYLPEPWEQHILLGYGVRPEDLR